MKQPDALPATDIGDVLVAGKILSIYNSEMKSRNITGSDQFDHCLAACRATQVTSNPRAVLELMALKEVKDYYAGRIGLYGDGRRRSHSEMRKDNSVDMAANRQGAACPLGESCARRCASYVPESSRIFLKNYIPEWGGE
ncbi:hypothetical protein [Stenotrophomonas maltophilia]|uniref:hypothetical protein n=1 Tax=Stenotrophomonas maltophilia TaxID=40324 RepID=UPI0009C0ADE4|nr:hypothetical protein [Stenotrophomonas maltophilia]